MIPARISPQTCLLPFFSPIIQVFSLHFFGLGNLGQDLFEQIPAEIRDFDVVA
jgi:hypothetical protein